MKKYFLLFGWICVLSFTSPCLAQSIQQTEVNGESTLIFRIKASDMGLSESGGPAFLIADGKKPNDTIEISLPGKLFEPPQEVSEINKQNLDRTTPEKAAASFFSANKSGDKEWMVENWTSKDQGEIKEFVENKEVIEKSQGVFKTIKKMVILGKADYKNCVILFTRYDYQNGKFGVPMIQTYINTQDGWKTTNALAADETKDIVWAALRLWDNKWLTQN